jgi:TonB family protein
MAEETQVLLELTQYSLHALRAVNGTVEAGGECALENKVALEALLDTVAPTRKTDGLKAAATVWPASVSWYLSTDTEAMLDRTADSLRAIAAAKQKDPKAALAYSACNAGDGGGVTPDGTDKWLLAYCALSSLEKASVGLLDLKVDPVDVTPTLFSGIGAIATALRLEGKNGAVALWDIGNDGSSLVLVTGAGAQAAVTCAVGMDAIIEAVQTALKLKFRGAGARLFFNDAYDFSDPGPRIAGLLGPLLKEALSQLPATPAPPALACLALTGKQVWFVREVATAAGIAHWLPDVPKLASALGLKLSEGAEASISSASSGLLGLLSARMNAREAWNPAWVEAEGQAEEPEPAPVVEPEPEPVPEPEPTPKPAPTPAPLRSRPSISVDTTSAGSAPRPPRPVVAPRSVSAPPIPSQTQTAAMRPPAPPASPRPAAPPPAPPPSHSQPPIPAHAPPAPSFAAPPPAVSPPTLSFPPPAPSFSTPPHPPRPSPPPASDPIPPSRPPSFSNPGFPMPAAEPDPVPAAAPPLPSPVAGVRMGVPAASGQSARGVTALPFEAAKLKPGTPPGTTGPAAAPAPPPPDEPPERKSKIGFYISVGVVASLLAAAIAVVLEAHKAKTDANDLEQQEALAHHNADLLLKEQEQKAKDDAERTRKEMEEQIAAAKKQTEEDTRRAVLAEIEADRLSKLPGSLVVATVPAGASVVIDGGAPLASPVKAEGLAPGTHRVQISLKGFDPVDMSLEIKGSKATDLGSVALQASFGTIDLTSTPDGLDFAVRPAADPKGTPVSTGKTPATVGDIVHGDYLVTFSRPGCRDHVETVSVKKGFTSPVDTKYVDGSLELTSEPSGATVSKDGTFLGTTPLTLHDLTPKTASFDLTLPGYDPTPVSCEIPEGQSLKYSAQLLRKDRVFKPTEVKTAPERSEGAQPTLSASQKKTGAEVLISLVVRRDGTVSDVQVVKSTDDDVARRCKTAIEKWKFRPATAPDDRTVDAAIEVPFKFTAASK